MDKYIKFGYIGCLVDMPDKRIIAFKKSFTLDDMEEIAKKPNAYKD